MFFGNHGSKWLKKEESAKDGGWPFLKKRLYYLSTVLKLFTKLKYNDELPSLYDDMFCYLRQIIRAWKDHMQETFVL